MNALLFLLNTHAYWSLHPNYKTTGIAILPYPFLLPAWINKLQSPSGSQSIAFPARLDIFYPSLASWATALLGYSMERGPTALRSQPAQQSHQQVPTAGLRAGSWPRCGPGGRGQTGRELSVVLSDGAIRGAERALFEVQIGRCPRCWKGRDPTFWRTVPAVRYGTVRGAERSCPPCWGNVAARDAAPPSELRDSQRLRARMNPWNERLPRVGFAFFPLRSLLHFDRALTILLSSGAGVAI